MVDTTELLEELFDKGCGFGEALVDGIGGEVRGCRVIGGFGMDPQNEDYHKDLDVMIEVDDTSVLVGESIRASVVSAVTDDDVITKELDVFACDDTQCVIPVTSGRGIKKQTFQETDTRFQESGFDIGEIRE